jgi:hypothetical protein
MLFLLLLNKYKGGKANPEKELITKYWEQLSLCPAQHSGNGKNNTITTFTSLI